MHNDLPFGSHITIIVFIYAKQHLIKKKKEEEEKVRHYWPNPSLEYNTQAQGTPRVGLASQVLAYHTSSIPTLVPLLLSHYTGAWFCVVGNDP